MKSRSALFFVAVVLSLGAVVAWYLFRPELLFIDRHVDEPFPATEAVEGDPTPSRTEAPARIPLDTPQRIAAGSFTSLAHPTNGTATVYVLPDDGGRVLRLTDFRTSNGPDVHVYLIESGDEIEQSIREGRFIDLGSMKGNIGDQTYAIPDDVTIDSDHGVSIWCARFGVNFGEARLSRLPGDQVQRMGSDRSGRSCVPPGRDGIGSRIRTGGCASGATAG